MNQLVDQRFDWVLADGLYLVCDLYRCADKLNYKKQKEKEELEKREKERVEKSLKRDHKRKRCQ